MNKWIIFAVIVGLLWFVVMPYLGIPATFTVPTFAFLLAFLFILKGFPQTNKYVPTFLPFSSKMHLLLGVGILILGISMFGWFASFGVPNVLGSIGLGNIGGTTPTGTVQTQTGNCYLATAPSLTVLFNDELSGASAAGLTNYAYRRTGTSTWTTGTGSSASISGDPGSKWEFIVAPDNTTYYGNQATFTVPCESYPRVEIKTAAIANPGDTAALSWAYNTDGTVNKAGAEQAMGASATYTLPFRIEGTYQKAVGSPYAPYGLIATCKYNTTTTSQFYVQDSSGNTYPTAPTPASVAGASGFALGSFYMPKIEGSTTYSGKIYIKTSATQPDVLAGNYTCFFDDLQLYYDSNDNTYKFGAVDETNSGVGMTKNELNFTIRVT